MKSHYSMMIFWSQEDNCYVVHLPDFPFQDIHTHGNTYEEAAKHGQQVIESYLQLYQENNQPLPQAKNPLEYFQVA